MAECLALADLGASINLMPLSVWNKLSLPDLSPTCMTLELADRSISRLVGVAEDGFFKVGTFHFLADFVVVDFDVDPQVPLILERCFLKIKRDLIDVFEGKLTLRVGKEAITLNLNQTSRYSANYIDMTANRIDVIDMACEEYSHEVLDFSDVIAKVDHSYTDTEGDILLLEAFLNDDPSLPPPNQGNYLPEVHKELKIYEAKSENSSIDEPPEVELKDLPPHLEYAFLEGDDKFPVIIMKDLSIKEKTALITDPSAQRSESSSSITSSSDTKIAALKAEMVKINKNLMRELQVNQQVKAVTPNSETYGGPHSFSDCPATVGQTQNVYAVGAYQGNIITNLKEELKGITTRSETAYQGPMILTTSSSLPPIVEREIEETKETPVVAPIIEPVVAPVSAPKPNQRPSIPYPSRLHDQKIHDKANDQREKFFQFFKDLNFNISFADALILMPKFGLNIKTLLTKKENLFELARTPLNEHCSTVLLKKLPEKLGDPGKFLIPCDFPEMAECLALADLDASINLMPLSMWNKLSLPDLSPTCMTLELADRSISRPVEVAKDVFVKVGTFHFLTDFVVVDLDADPRVPLILGRYFLKTERALINVFEGELTLRVGTEAITFNLDQTSRYSANYNEMTARRIDIIDMACEEYSQEVLSFSNVIASGNPTPYYDPIVSITSSTLTPFGESDFLLEEVDAFLALEDDPTSPEVDQSYIDTKGDIIFLEAFLNDDPSLPPPNQGNYLPKDLPTYLKYTFLEGDDKLPVIIAKGLSVEEKTALITVLKSHKRAIAWKLSDIKGIDPEFCTHKILMKEDFEPVVQH
nr:reverse transcriptase domain-containing protein [Tanacetum cinerariifolium]